MTFAYKNDLFNLYFSIRICLSYRIFSCILWVWFVLFIYDRITSRVLDADMELHTVDFPNSKQYRKHHKGIKQWLLREFLDVLNRNKIDKNG